MTHKLNRAIISALGIVAPFLFPGTAAQGQCDPQVIQPLWGAAEDECDNPSSKPPFSTDPLVIPVSPIDLSYLNPSSYCWWWAVEDACGENTIDEFQGYPLNVNLAWGAASGEYAPLSYDPFASSFPLIPADAAQLPMPMYEPRRTLGGVTDAMHGVPLLQEIDFELPFGGAVYRHIRTFAEIPSDAGVHWNTCFSENHNAQELFWDWNGQGWMLGVNPLFLVDSNYTSYSYTQNDNHDLATCYFMPDAHRSIGFKLLQSSDPPAYTAPLYQDALLSYSDVGILTGTPAWETDIDNPNTGSPADTFATWTNPPAMYYVSAQRGSVRYSIEPQWGDDVGPGEDGLHEHLPSDRQSGGWGTGIPFLGLVKAIDDRAGNRISIEYCPQVQGKCSGTPQASFGDCDNCCQNCHERGQIRRVRLESIDEEGETIEVHWTLVFVHRSFPGGSIWWGNAGAVQGHEADQNAVHTVYAFRGEGPETVPDCMTIDYSVFADALDEMIEPDFDEPDDAADALALLDSVDPLEVFSITDPDWDQWVFKAKYLYTEHIEEFPLFSSLSQPEWFGQQVTYGAEESESPRLLKSTVTERIVVDPDSVTNWEDVPQVARSTLYRYALGDNRFDPTKLRAVWKSDAVEAARQGFETSVAQSGPTWHEDVLDRWPYGLMTCGDNHTLEGFGDRSVIPLLDREEDSEDMVLVDTPIDESASMQFMSWQAVAAANSLSSADSFTGVGAGASEFAFEMLDEYIGNAKSTFFRDGNAIFVDRRIGDSIRVNRLYRFLKAPAELEQDIPAAVLGSVPVHRFGIYPTFIPESRMLHHEPFKWVRYLGGTAAAASDILLFDETDSRFWITVSDEYDSLTDALSLGFNDEDTTLASLAAEYEIGDPQPRPLSRRLWEMSPRGHTLASVSWQSPSYAENLEEGLRQTWEYDDHGRMVKHMTYGFHASEDDPKEGLIRVFGYENPVEGDPDPVYDTNPIWTGVQMEEEGDIIYLTQRLFEKDGQSGDTTEVKVTYSLPTSTLFADVEAFLDDPDTHDPASGRIWTISQKATASAAIPGLGTSGPLAPSMGSADDRPYATLTISGPVYDPASTPQAEVLLYAFEQAAMDSQGRQVWRGYGQINTFPDPLDPTEPMEAVAEGDWERVFWDFTEYDQWGRTVRQVRDCDYASLSLSSDPTEFFGEPERVLNIDSAFGISSIAPLSLETKYEFYSNRTKKTIHPDGSIENSLWGVEIIGDKAYPLELVLKYREGIDYNQQQQGYALTLLGPISGSLQDPQGGVPFRIRMGPGASVLYVPGHNEDPSNPIGGWFDHIQGLEIEIPPGVSGMPEELNATTDDGDSLSVQMSTGWYGEFKRERSPLGVIRRYEHDYRGRPIRSFVGSKDYSAYFGVGVQTPDDDMVLYESKAYGESSTDANELVEEWRYRNRSSANRSTAPAAGDRYSKHEYDWRMRRVLTRDGEYSGSADDDERITATYLDNAGRVRFVAVHSSAFSASTYSSGNPTELVFNDALPDAADLLGESSILSLSETIYDGQGKVAETRAYDVSDSYGLTYLASYTNTGFNGTPIEIRSSNGPTVKSLHDARGNEIVRIETVDYNSATWQMRRIETVTDLIGNPIRIDTFERIPDTFGSTGEEVLETGSTPNAVVSTVFNWYESSRLMCTADLGTGNSTADEFTNDTSTHSRSTDEPVDRSSEGIPYQIKSTTGLPSYALIEAYGYEPKGKVGWTLHPDETLTEQVYSDLGKLAAVIEYDEFHGDELRVTRYKYETGMLSAIGYAIDPTADSDWVTGASNLLKKELHYGADIVYVDGSGDLQVTSENKDTLAAIYFEDLQDERFLGYSYYADGSLATRTDSRGVEFSYFYDVLDRLAKIAVDHSVSTPPADFIDEVLYTHDPLGRLTDVESYASANPQQMVDVAFNKFTYDAFGNLLREYQSYGQPVNTSTSPFVEYEWDFQTADNSGANYNRLTAMTYPERPDSSGPRVVEFEFDDDEGDDGLSRVTRILDSSGTAFNLARYRYFGDNRLASAEFGDDSGSPVLTVGQTGGAMLDRFGRIKKLHYDGDQDLTFEYAYNTRGSRTQGKATYRDLTTQDQSWDYGYDLLQRLTSADTGEVSGGSISSPTTAFDWTLDSRGNWEGFLATAGSNTTLIEHEVNDRSEILEIDTTVNGGTPTEVAHTYDEGGNLTHDGSFTYVYDAWGRVIEVRNSSGSTWLAHFTYDGLGRLIRLQRPYPGYVNGRRIEHYYYDGSRRIQEIFHDPIADLSEEESTGGEGEIAEWVYTDYAAMEYVHSPFYVDELVCQFAVNDFTAPWFAVRDANYNIVGLVDDTGDVILQRSFTPYGELLWEETFVSGSGQSGLPWVRAGHQGLFYDRLDGFYASTPITTISKGLYHNRNRSYSPHLGRFVQADPNATGLLTSHADKRGAGPNATVASSSLDLLLGDGFNIHIAYGASPTCQTDSSGLFLGSMAGLAMSLGTTADIQGHYNGKAFETGITFATFISGLLQAYEGDMDARVDWASDWSYDDDLFDRPVDESTDVWDDGSGQEHYVATLGGVGQFIALSVARSRLLNKVVKEGYDAARKMKTGLAGLQAHHLIEVRHFKWLTKGLSGSTGKVPAVILSSARHKLITHELQTKLPTGREHTIEKIWEVYQEVYGKLEGGQEWLDAIRHYFQ